MSHPLAENFVELTALLDRTRAIAVRSTEVGIQTLGTARFVGYVPLAALHQQVYAALPYGGTTTGLRADCNAAVLTDLIHTSGRVRGVKRRVVDVRRGGSPTTRWQTVFGLPGPHLRHAVSSYGEYFENSTSPVSRREIPGPATVLIIELDEPLHAVGAAEDGKLRPVSAFVGSPGRGPAITWHRGRQHCVEVRLTLLGAYRMFGAMSELAGRIVTLDSLWQGSASRLAERLVAADNIEARFDVLDQVLSEALSVGPSPDPEVSYAWDRLQNAGREVAIGDLLSETGWSRARLAKRFRAQIGMPPKAAASMLRFNQAAEMLLVQRNSSLVSVALSCGYYDQAHLNRDFRRLAGCTPMEWMRAQFTELVGAGTVPGRRRG